MIEVSDKELSEMIADLSLTENWPDRTRLCLALIELRSVRQMRIDAKAWNSRTGPPV